MFSLVSYLLSFIIKGQNKIGEIESRRDSGTISCKGGILWRDNYARFVAGCGKTLRSNLVLRRYSLFDHGGRGVVGSLLRFSSHVLPSSPALPVFPPTKCNDASGRESK